MSRTHGFSTNNIEINEDTQYVNDVTIKCSELP